MKNVYQNTKIQKNFHVLANDGHKKENKNIEKKIQHTPHAHIK